MNKKYPINRCLKFKRIQHYQSLSKIKKYLRMLFNRSSEIYYTMQKCLQKFQDVNDHDDHGHEPTTYRQ